ncbi:hypothetical protein B0T13DRAFT_476674 [Neurospora crassa]|nr:hypothetical protein B0T13DRAFT_476674 [Neurospora crassa]
MLQAHARHSFFMRRRQSGHRAALFAFCATMPGSLAFALFFRFQSLERVRRSVLYIRRLREFVSCITIGFFNGAAGFVVDK